jgi:hypothetical protein
LRKVVPVLVGCDALYEFLAGHKNLWVFAPAESQLGNGWIGDLV